MHEVDGGTSLQTARRNNRWFIVFGLVIALVMIFPAIIHFINARTAAGQTCCCGNVSTLFSLLAWNFSFGVLDG